MTKLMSPGGSVEMAVQALDAGADCVYVGPHGWSRRWEKYEMQDEDIRKVHAYAVSQGKSVSLCFNCHAASREIPILLKKIEGYVSQGIDNFTMLDFGVMKAVKTQFPECTIRASIATTAVNAEDVFFLRDIGVDNVVIRPDCFNPEEMRSLREQCGIEVELIVCGNLDYAFTGRCVMSCYVQRAFKRTPEGREMHPGSPNRGGLCHRVCLSDWDMREKGEPVFRGVMPNAHYYFYDELDAYLEVPIDWIKIQGRVYSTGHIARITTLYKTLLNEYAKEGRGKEYLDWKDRNRKEAESLFKSRDGERNQQTEKRLELDHSAVTVPVST